MLWVNEMMYKYWDKLSDNGKKFAIGAGIILIIIIIANIF